MKCLVIGDIHLKPKMFDQAHEILQKGLADRAVVLGDLVDDWGEEFNIPLYERTMKKAIWFQKEHPNTLWCLGNHDAGYYWPEWGKRESGHSLFAEVAMCEWLDEFKRVGIEQNLIMLVDNCLFSHAGVNKNWMKKHPEFNPNDPEERETSKSSTWEGDSPLWWRPQKEYGGDPDEAWGKDKYLQVVGHSPMKTPTQEGSILSCDVFSTYRNGAPYGDQHWVVVDTETKEWKDLGGYDDIV